jgi:hypothetical protein
MPTLNDTRDPVTPPFTFPVSEVLSRYLAMTAPTRSRAGAENRRPPSAQTARSNGSAHTRAEELWDSLGDFA